MSSPLSALLHSWYVHDMIMLLFMLLVSRYGCGCLDNFTAHALLALLVQQKDGTQINYQRNERSGAVTATLGSCFLLSNEYEREKNMFVSNTPK
jgi:hypothetical protein